MCGVLIAHPNSPPHSTHRHTSIPSSHSPPHPYSSPKAYGSGNEEGNEMDLATSGSHIDLQHMARDHTGVAKNYHKVKIALSLYKVQQNIYLLDFQRIEVRDEQ
jgi:hypothetical protein